MVDATHISFAANDRSYFSLLKKEIHRRSEAAGITADKLNAIDLVVAEMTSNLFKYAENGEILLGVFNSDGQPYVELLCIDSGPGIGRPSKILQDGYSSSNTMGIGLGSIKRLSDVFELYSQPGWGTIVLSRIYNKPVSGPKEKITVRPLIVSKPGEITSGDGMMVKKNGKVLKLMLCDGLGHGVEANKAINEAAIAFRACPDDSPGDMLRFIHSSIKKTRGAVINITTYDFTSRKWLTAGIGNIASRYSGPGTLKNHMSYNGIVGHNIPGSMSDQQYDGEVYNEVILCSDGIKTRWDLTKYPLINKYDLSILAAAIYKDHARRTDDMSIVIAKIHP